jgi:beta-lactamase superfamily II metal-dependent hydrolase
LLGWNSLPEIAEFRWNTSFAENRFNGMEYARSFLAPEASADDPVTSAKNDDSLVLRLQYGDRAYLLPGDAEKQSEHEILTANQTDAVRSYVLKIGHQRGKNSTTQPFLDAVRPQIGIISVGGTNPYGHPSPELLERLEAARVRILRTDRDGAVHVLTDGRQLEIHCFVPCLDADKTASVLAKVPKQE